MKTLQVITPRTDAEWEPDHPLRQRAKLVSNSAAARADYLVCTIVGEERDPPAPDDADVEDKCCDCGVGVMRRASAPAGPKPICWKCWKILSRRQD